MKQILKGLFARTQYRIVNRRRRWGIDLVDDLIKLNPPDEWKVIFDVGANVGQSAIRFSAAFPRAMIFSFEPFADSFQMLSKTAKRIAGGRVIPYNLALSDHNGEAALRVFADGAKNTLISELSDSMRNEETAAMVSTRTLDDFLRIEKIHHIDLLKIDVEGAELKVLQGAAGALQEKRVSYVYAEFHLFSEQADGAGVGGHTSFLRLLEFMRGFQMRPLTIYTDSVHLEEPMGTYNVLFGSL